MNAERKETELDEKEYEDVLNELYGDVEVCGMTYSAGCALRELDPTAFRCGKVDYEDQLDKDNPLWLCGECGDEYDDEDEAEECCKDESEEEEATKDDTND